MSMAAAELLAQRSPAVRTRTGQSGYAHLSQDPNSPRTPLLSRSLSSQYGSPGGYRADDELVIYDFGSRLLRVGFSGESAPKVIWQYGPSTNRRAGDYGPSPSELATDTIGDWELWDYDVNELDLDLVKDKLERAIRVINERYLLLDLKTRSAIVTVTPCLPNPLVELVVKTIFGAVNHPRSLYLVSSPILSVVAAGLRCGLVVDIGWHETTVTAVYEYREVSQKKSVRATQALSRRIEQLLQASSDRPVPFSIVEDVVTRLAWCKGHANAANNETSNDRRHNLGSAWHIDDAKVVDAVENSFFASRGKDGVPDDHEQPLATLLWRALLALPLDVRSVCVSRIIVTGGGGHIPGLQLRLLAELQGLVERNGWDPVQNGRSDSSRRPSGLTLSHSKAGHYGLSYWYRVDLGEKLEAGDAAGLISSHRTHDDDEQTLPPIHQRAKSHRGNSEEITPSAEQQDPNAMQPLLPEADEITEKLHKASLRDRPSPFQGEVRGVESLGAWSGASLMGHLRIEGSIEIKREDFLKHGMSILGYPI